MDSRSRFFFSLRLHYCQKIFRLRAWQAKVIKLKQNIATLVHSTFNISCTQSQNNISSQETSDTLHRHKTLFHYGIISRRLRTLFNLRKF